MIIETAPDTERRQWGYVLQRRAFSSQHFGWRDASEGSCMSLHARALPLAAHLSYDGLGRVVEHFRDVAHHLERMLLPLK